MPAPERMRVGWDVGGAHVKACLMQAGEVLDVAQWPCPLWLGLAHLDAVLERAGQRWPMATTLPNAVTMTGEMVDLFAHRQDGVQRIAARMASALAGPVHFFAGDQGWCGAAEAGALWPHVASANWLATARHVARWAGARGGCGVLVDIGSTTTDLIAFRGGAVLGTSRTDTQRLASGELVYQGVVRTPLCALAPRIAFQGAVLNVMNEFFATTADVYRLTGELDPAHDQHPSADGAPKDAAPSRQRLARMVGLDARDAPAEDWQTFALAWRAAQLAEIGGQLRRVLAHYGLGDEALVVGAGCGAFLLPDLCAAAGLTPGVLRFDYGSDVVRTAAGATGGVDGRNGGQAGLRAWARVCAPSVAVAALFDEEAT